MPNLAKSDGRSGSVRGVVPDVDLPVVLVPGTRGRLRPHLLPVRGDARASPHPRLHPLDGVARAGRPRGPSGPVGRGRDRLWRVAESARTPRSPGGSSAVACSCSSPATPSTSSGTRSWASRTSRSRRSSTPSTSRCTRCSQSDCCLLARARVPGGDRASLIDALTDHPGRRAAVVDLPHRTERPAPGDLLVRLTSAAYPLGDVLVLAMLAHLWSAGGFRNTAGRLLAIGAVGTLISDSLYGLANLHPAELERRQPHRPRVDPLLRLLGRGSPAPVDARALRTAAGGADHEPAGPGSLLLAAVSLIAPIVLLVEPRWASRWTPRSSPWWPG